MNGANKCLKTMSSPKIYSQEKISINFEGYVIVILRRDYKVLLFCWYYDQARAYYDDHHDGLKRTLWKLSAINVYIAVYVK